jgi:lipid-A-disaccharide synthase-like uncharacterized protein
MMDWMDFWLVFGFAAQFCFFLRFFLQWIASEREKKSVIPVHFWYFSILGGAGLLVYAVHIMDPVFILGQSLGLLIYIRNLLLIRNDKRKEPQL